MSSNTTHVVLSFDIDGETLWTSRDKVNRIGPVMMSQGYYGPEIGVPRILKLLQKHNLPATFFLTGFIADHYTDSCRYIIDEGHEIAHHNYDHEWPPRTEPEKEREVFKRGMDALYRLTGTQPAGYRAPGWEFSEITFDLLQEYGIRYSSNMMDDEKPYEFTRGGKRTGIIELPVSWILDDAAFFMHGITYGAPMFPPSAVLEQWKAEFDGLYAEGDGRVYVLTMHPQIIGRTSRMSMLEDLISYIKSLPGVTFYRAVDLVDKLATNKNTRRRAYDR